MVDRNGCKFLSVSMDNTHKKTTTFFLVLKMIWHKHCLLLLLVVIVAVVLILIVVVFLITNNIAMSRSIQIVLFSFKVIIDLEVHSRKPINAKN